MTTKLITFDNPLCLDEIKELEPYYKQNIVHICATESLRKGMQAMYKNLCMGPVVRVGLIIDKLLGDWSEPETMLLQHAHLSKVLRTRQEQDESNKQLRAFRRNQADVLNTMRFLTEIGLTSGQLSSQPDLTKDEELFVKIWSEMETTHPDFSNVRERFRILEDPATLRNELFKKLLSIEGISSKLLPNDHFPSVVLHGFYFITPIQYKLFSLMKNAGIELIFANLYDQRFPNTFSTVRTFLEPWATNGWTMHKSSEDPNSWGERFASLFEEVETQMTGSLEESIPIVAEYRNFQGFLTSFLDERESSKFYSPRYETLNERIKEYKPELFDDRHLLAYPIGQYLFHLHKMWDEDKRKTAINSESLYVCFSSGWLRTRTHEAKEYTHVLREILPFFSECRTLDEWRKQATLLRTIKRDVVNSFDDLEGLGPDKKRFHQMMGNPMLRFSYFKVSESDLNVVLDLMEALFETADDLFGGSNEITLHDHFKKIDQLLQDRFQNNSTQLLDEERKVIDQLRNSLGIERRFEKVLVHDLANAVALYLAGGFKKNEGAVGKFEDCDAAALFKNKAVHLCGLDEESLPYGPPTNPWPLTKQTLQFLSENSIELNMLLLKERESASIARYLMYSVLAFHSDVTLSWMREWDQKELQESVYVLVLGVEKTQKENSFEITSDLLPAPTMDKTQVHSYWSVYPKDAIEEQALCPRRFYYSHLASDFATYRDDFHHEWLYNHLIKSAAMLSGEPELAVAETEALFPHWSPVKKKDLRETAERGRNFVKLEFSQYDGRQYINERTAFQFLANNDSSISERISKADHDKFISSVLEDNEMQMKAEPGEYCMYCPHLSYCQDGSHPVDKKGRRR